MIDWVLRSTHSWVLSLNGTAIKTYFFGTRFMNSLDEVWRFFLVKDFD